MIDSVENDGVELSGSDGSVMGDLDGDGHIDVVSVHESDTTYDGKPDGHIRIAFGSADPDAWVNVTLSEGEEAAAPRGRRHRRPQRRRTSRHRRRVRARAFDLLPEPRQGCADLQMAAPHPATDRRPAAPTSASSSPTSTRDGKPEVIAPNKGGQNPPLDIEESHPFELYEIQVDPLEPQSWVRREIGRARIPMNTEPYDLDQDGDLDVLSGSRAENRVLWFENVSEKGGEIRFVERRIDIEGTSVPQEQRRRGRPAAPHALVTGFNFDYADLNGDGRIDLILREESNLIWLEQPRIVRRTLALAPDRHAQARCDDGAELRRHRRRRRPGRDGRRLQRTARATMTART